MGYYADKSGNLNTSIPITWQATYLRNGYLTVWMANNYTVDYFNARATTSSGWGNGTDYYSTNGNRDGANYSQSTAHDITLNIYSAMSQKLSNFSNIIKSPQEAGATWQRTQANGSHNTNDKSVLNGMESNPTGGGYMDRSDCNPFDYPWISVYNDKFWLPSSYEIYSTSVSSSSSTNGLWQVNNSNLRNPASSTPYHPNSSNTSTNSFLRSGNSFTSSTPTQIATAGSNMYTGTSSLAGVRPACHISLEYLANLIGYEYGITASISSGGADKATVDKTIDGYYTGYQPTFTYTSSTNYYIDSITISTDPIEIYESYESTFRSNSGYQYKCYRDTNKVIVVLTNLTKELNIVGTYATLWSISSLNEALVLQSNTDYTRENYFDTTVQIVAEFSQNQNVQFTLDGVTVKLYGNNSSGKITLPSGSVDYAHNIFEHTVVIEFTNLPNGPHTCTIDHYVGTTASINATFSGGSGTIEMYKDENGVQLVIMRPDTGLYVESFDMDGYQIAADYYRAEVFGIGSALQVRYTAKDSTNVFVVELESIFDNVNINFNLSSLKPSYKVPPASSGGASVTGTVVTAGIGGEARIVGNDIANGDDNDTVTFVALAYSNYVFVGWVDASDESEIISTSTTAVLTRDQVNGKIIKALFAPANQNSQTNGTLDDPLNGADII